MYYTYILISKKDNKTYVGFSKDIVKRLKDHNSGKVKSTYHRRPFKILFIEKLPTLKEAKIREKYWKNGSGRRKLKHFFDKGFPPIQF